MDFIRGMKFATLVALTTLALGIYSHALAADQNSEVRPQDSQYFSVNEQPVEENFTKKSNSNYNPTSLVSIAPFSDIAIRRIVINMLQWILHPEPRPIPTDKYIRKPHFGRWINDPTDDTCMNTRAKVLVRDSSAPVTYRGSKTCVVENGRWYDAYTDAEIGSSRQIQIDHLVPLKNAYMSGAWQWDYKTRCLYANYMGYKDHLIAAEAHQNMAKGDRGPEGYMPPNESYRCEYVRNWLTVKTIWGLSMTHDEAQAIHDTVQAYNCDIGSFRLLQGELRKQRENIQANLEFCTVNKR